MSTRSWAVLLAVASAFQGGRGIRAEGAAAAWPNWLGPTHNGVAAERGVFARTAGVRLEKAWSRPLETGPAGLAVADGRVFTLFREGGDDYAIALRADTGTETWRARLDPGVESPWLSGPPSTPAFHEARVFTLSSACRLRAHEAATGRRLWELDLKQRFGTAYQMGCVSSPFVEGGRLYVMTGGRADHRVAALDPKSGELLWTAKGTETASNASPVSAQIGGVRQLLFNHNVAFQKGGITGLRLSDGALLWSTTLPEGWSFDTPSALPEGRVSLQTADGIHVLRVVRKDDAWSVVPLWRSADLRAYVSPPVLQAGHLFGLGGDHLACVELETGRTAWREKTYPGSLILVDGHLIVLSTSAGLLRVVEAVASGYREKARLQLFNRGAQTLAPPSFSGRRIFVRNEEEVAAVEIS